MADGKKEGLRESANSPLPYPSFPLLRLSTPGQAGYVDLCPGTWEKSLCVNRLKYYVLVRLATSLRKHPFLLALRRRETPPSAKSEEKRMFSQASGETYECVVFRMFSQGVIGCQRLFMRGFQFRLKRKTLSIRIPALESSFKAVGWTG